MPVKSTKDFIAMAKARPNQITFASNGEGANLHVQMALFTLMTGIQLVHVPYKGGVPVATSLASGETQSSISTIGIVLAHIKSGRLRPIAVTAAKRSTILPELPTIADSGVPGYEMSPWVGVFAPAHTPAAIVERLHVEVNKAIMKPDFARILAEQALEPWRATRQEFVAQMKSDYAKFERIFKAIGTPKN
jgi:tripartite-type tricarboxylate transporter receptor subunit TctC